MVGHSFDVFPRFTCLLLLALVPAHLFCQITIRERIDIGGVPARTSTATAGTTLPTLRFEYTTCCLFYPTTLFVTMPGGTILTALGTGGATLTIPNAPGGVYFLRLQEEVGWNSNVWLEARERIYRDTVLVRDSTYLKRGGPGYVRWYPPPYQTPVNIRITLASSELQPLGDHHNKANPNRADTLRPMVIDFSRVSNTPMMARVNYDDGTPARSYRLTFWSFGKDTTGGHGHETNRPGGRFLNAREDTLNGVQIWTDSAGIVQTKYFCSGFGGTDSIFVRGASPTDTATAFVTVKVKGLGELQPSNHYEMVGAFGEPDVKSRHRVNHYGTENLRSKLKTLADSVYANSSSVLRINDMSLIWGGPFDITNNWDTPHEKHRGGINADVSYYDTRGIQIPQKYFERKVKSLGGDLRIHGHFHLIFP